MVAARRVPRLLRIAAIQIDRARQTGAPPMPQRQHGTTEPSPKEIDLQLPREPDRSDSSSAPGPTPTPELAAAVSGPRCPSCGGHPAAATSEVTTLLGPDREDWVQGLVTTYAIAAPEDLNVPVERSSTYVYRSRDRQCNGAWTTNHGPDRRLGRKLWCVSSLVALRAVRSGQIHVAQRAFDARTIAGLKMHDVSAWWPSDVPCPNCYASRLLRRRRRGRPPGPKWARGS